VNEFDAFRKSRQWLQLLLFFFRLSIELRYSGRVYRCSHDTSDKRYAHRDHWSVGANLSDCLAGMREWLDRHRYDPFGSCTTTLRTRLSCLSKFPNEWQVEAFAMRFDGEVPARYLSC
jgi:hypothetical protein